MITNGKVNNQQSKKVIIPWLAHHDPNRPDFEDHIFYLFNYAVCIGCFAFFLGATLALIIGNIFFSYIVNYISFSLALTIFFIGWIPSILQYSLQIKRKRPLKNRSIKFICRILYPVGSILFIFNSPLLGFCISVPAGYFIVYIRKIKNKTLISNKKNIKVSAP
ncbi:MAG: hypothetical protein ACFFA0_12485 [Promethearchaeota archaeon]